ncbi:unnamed protein product [Pieris macdunnoughi]|uniref:Uncharacterized protein n=1 Tax=Pieris macdunnoughi TaxID=345717 RepID=A0A821SPP9_9NEOP|nr:unnamed protein product [Pieris macdunnoughi]
MGGVNLDLVLLKTTQSHPKPRVRGLRTIWLLPPNFSFSVMCVYACVSVDGVSLRLRTQKPAARIRITAEQSSARESSLDLTDRTVSLQKNLAVSATVQPTGFLADATTSPAVPPWFLNPISINIPIPKASAGSIPVVLLPVPVPMQSECRAPALQTPIHRQISEKAALVDHTPQLDPDYEDPEEIDRTHPPRKETYIT